MRKTFTTLSLATIPALSLLASAPAHADEVTATATAEAATADAPSGDRTFGTLDRVGARSGAGVDVSFVDFDEQSLFREVSLMRVDLHGRYVHRSGVGVAIDVPVTRARNADNPMDEGTTELGSATIDGLYALRQGKTSLFLRAGLVLPTGQREDTVLHALGSLPRITDLPVALGDATTLRLGVSPQLELGAFFARADVGFDAVLFQIGDAADSDRPGPWGHANLGIGVDGGGFDLTAELATLMEFDGFDDVDALTTGAVSLSLTDLPVKPHVTAILPIDSDMRDALDAAVMLGLQGQL